jgi:hypothetical protein
MTGLYYILKGHDPVPCDDVVTWSTWYATADRVVARDDLGAYVVSTVFLGLDHNFAATGRPILFETMVFRDQTLIDVDQDRYATWDEAAAGHAALVARYKRAKKPPRR